MTTTGQDAKEEKRLMTAPTGPLQRAIVKLVTSGDTIVIRDQPRGGPPPEKTISLSGINAPRLGRRTADGKETPDEPFAWEARELLREKLVGQNIIFSVDYTVPSGREFVRMYLPNASGDGPGENVAELLLAEGLAEVRVGQRGLDEYTAKLDAVQQQAKAAKKGRWEEGAAKNHVRHVCWVIDDMRALVDKFKQKPQKAIIEHVRDGSTVRAFLLPDFYHVTVMFSGIKCPTIRLGPGGEVTDREPFAEEAKFFTECRLLQRNVEVILEGVTNQAFIGSVIHPKGSVAELLLREGLARCIDWSIGMVSAGPEPYRKAERLAKEHRLRMWRNHTPVALPSMSQSSRTFNAKVIEIGFGDNITVIKEGTTTPMRVFFSSIRPPRSGDAAGDKENAPLGRQFRPLYDIPYMFEAREFLRKKLIGKTVSVTIDYVQPASDNFPEKTACTVMMGEQNIAEQLLLRGLATCIRYRADDDQRSPHYDTLLAAQAQAEKERLRLHSLTKDAESDAPKKKNQERAVMRVQDLTGDATKSKQFFPSMQRIGRTDAIVEFVASGSRLRIYVPRETCLMTLLLAGIQCPRTARPTGAGAGPLSAEPFGQEALDFVRMLVLQRDVQVEVETMDKGGNMVGWMFTPESDNLSVLLVENGLASVHFTAERSRYYSQLQNAERRAKEKRLNLWKDYEEPTNDTTLEDAMTTTAVSGGAAPGERKTDYKSVVITECVPVENQLRVAVQRHDDGAHIEQLMKDLHAEFDSNRPAPGTYTPRKNDICAALFSVDNQWYRAKVEAVNKNGTADVLYIDFGNRETVDVAKNLAPLPDRLKQQRPGAHEFTLAFVSLKNVGDEEKMAAARELARLTAEAKIGMNVEYKAPTGDAVTFAYIDKLKAKDEAGSSSTTAGADDSLYTADIGLALVRGGFALADVPPRMARRYPSLGSHYVNAQQHAKQNRLALWRYGDFTSDEL